VLILKLKGVNCMKMNPRKFASEEKAPISDLYDEYPLHPTEFSTKYEYK
jgi:hypothetical protein